MDPAKVVFKTLGIAPLSYTYRQPWPTVPEQAFEESNLTVPPALGDIHKSTPSSTGIPFMPHNYEGSSSHWVSESTSRPYSVPTTSSQRGCRLPPASHELDIRKLQQRLFLEGGDLRAIKLVERVFSKGVTMEALTRRLTREEAALYTFGYRAGPLYLAFLEPIPSHEKANGALPCRYRCRLCPSDGKALTWKHHRDMLRHLRKEHFGLGEQCRTCGKQAYTKSELKNHQRTCGGRSYLF